MSALQRRIESIVFGFRGLIAHRAMRVRTPRVRRPHARSEPRLYSCACRAVERLA
jgi:hypothetical protein